MGGCFTCCGNLKSEPLCNLKDANSNPSTGTNTGLARQQIILHQTENTRRKKGQKGTDQAGNGEGDQKIVIIGTIYIYGDTCANK